MNKLFTNRYVKFVAFLCIFVGIERFCFQRTAGFRHSKIISDIPAFHVNDETINPSLMQEKLLSILQQNFFYIGHGGTCYNFESEDKLYVLKLFKHQHLQKRFFLQKIPLPKPFHQIRDLYIKKREKQHAHKRLEFLFKSCLLAYQHLPNETGIVHLQLQKGPLFLHKISLFDKIKIKHEIPLAKIEFVLQRKVQLIFEKLAELLIKKDYVKAKNCIDSLFELILARCYKGLADRDPHLEINFGYIEEKAFEIDLGSFYEDPFFKKPFSAKREIYFISLELKEWLKRQKAFVESSFLLDYLNFKVNEILQYDFTEA